ncbi:hypothetical protein niasHT_019559 [Heterodera trifolii]|uniref:Uncharacterized protein n=1 Tax=Heterodera trifolii TaxID=157864 RepID=A0ABD2K6U6_9BILA
MAYCGGKWLFCCCCHVTKAAHIMAWLSLLWALFVGTLSFVFVPLFSTYSLVSVFLALVTNLPIIVFDLFGKRSHRIYLPFLLINGICILFGLSQIVYLFLHSVLMFKVPDFFEIFLFGFSLKEIEKGRKKAMLRHIYTAVVLFLLCYQAIFCFIYSVIFRAYKFTKEIGGTSNGRKVPT